ncbi:hypothetical protein HPP92_022845 [Vanilla planifolia]|uniref:Uncharacterized protein n=1 Tax=Vanilla planifolia TaxID=51239 RepID=A0A835UDX4_VANPL|nr:hypothetical protein HPP92_022845 [Vanilla planifolia]
MRAMAGRGRLSAAHVLQLRDSQPPLLGLAPPPQVAHLMDGPPMVRLVPMLHGPHPSIIAVEERLAAQHREIQVLLADNQHLAATHVALKQEVDASRHELRHATATAAKVRAERDAEVREVLDRSVKAEAEALVVEGMRAELAQVRADVQRLGATRNDLLERLQGLKSELARAREDLGQASAMQAEIEAMNREIQRAELQLSTRKRHELKTYSKDRRWRET